ncbi:MAG: hypothetical protein ACJ764_06990 [Solirubrobacteraceae bacterium]
MAASKSSDRQRKSRAPKKGSASSRSASRSGSSSRRSKGSSSARSGSRSDGLTGLAEQLANRILKPLGLVILSRERIAETLHEAAAQGRLTRGDAEDLASELVQRGRQQTEELLSDLDRAMGRGRQPWDSTAKRARVAATERLVRGADRARRSIGVGPSFPILGYDDLSVAQVQSRLGHLSDPELRRVRDYERRHANRKSLLSAVEKALG